MEKFLKKLAIRIKVDPIKKRPKTCVGRQFAISKLKNAKWYSAAAVLDQEFMELYQLFWFFNFHFQVCN